MAQGDGGLVATQFAHLDTYSLSCVLEFLDPHSVLQVARVSTVVTSTAAYLPAPLRRHRPVAECIVRADTQDFGQGCWERVQLIARTAD